MALRQWIQALIVCGTLMLVDEAAAQAVFPSENGKVLAGLKMADATVQILTWLGMDGDRDRLKRNIQSAFELALRRDGLVVDGNAPNFLFCELKFARSGGVIAYAYQVTYYEFEANGVHRLLWSHGGIVTVGRETFDTEQVAKDCVDAFSNEWLKRNPRR